MDHSHTVEVTCPSGHLLRAPERAIGRTLPCPVCQQPVTVTRPQDPLSDTGVMRILGNQIMPIDLRQQPSPASTKRDELSDTGVMRILGDYKTSQQPVFTEEMPTMRRCPVCSRGVPDASSVCKHCHCYVGPSPDYMRSLNPQLK
ncbi:hypothetical protein CA13_59410 [Planctomycetes bacterium CA13]|uniref:Double zinc ribbon n=2 Tax=Novipirellula herctigrandis TaxID=2527986 RepID=A0A5C5ZD10_9BACT|nr:hypothetical protein CA13_59410 [Planctomycetes bacterium CA13]